METAKIFENGRSQAVRLPKKFRFNTDEVIVQQLGDAVILVPKESMWQTFIDGLNRSLLFSVSPQSKSLVQAAHPEKITRGAPEIARNCGKNGKKELTNR